MTHPEAFQGTMTETLTLQDSQKLLDQLTDPELLQREQRALIIHRLVGETHEQHREAAVLEIDHIARIAQGRTIDRTHEDGSRSVYFATRDTTGENPRLDDIYELTQHPDGSTSFQIDFMRSGDCGYRIVGDKEGSLYTFALMENYKKQLERGSWSEQRFMEDYVDRSLETARIMKTRRKENPAAADQADQEAKEMLAAYLEAYEVTAA